MNSTARSLVRAFTLIELLVVIAIIAILAGIALPVFNKVQERGRATSDASNLRQLGIGMQAYLNDHEDQMFPLEGEGDKSWPNRLNPKYVPGWKVFRSPFDVPTQSRPINEIPPVPVSYGINTECFVVRDTAKYVSPSQLVFMAPKMEPTAVVTFLSTSENHPKLLLPQPSQGAKGRLGTHFNRSQINALYADWHVASTNYTEYSTSQTEEGKKRWYPEAVDPAQQ